jgi:TonB family protein
MKTPLLRLTAILLLILGLTAAQQRAHDPATDPDIVKGILEDIYKGKIVTLQSFNQTNNIVYDIQGELQSKLRPGDWTLYGLLEIHSVSVNHKRIRFSAHRIWAKYHQTKSKWEHVRSPFGAKVTIKLDHRSLAGPWNTALAAAFLAGNKDLADIAPPHWQPFLRGEAPDAEELLAEVTSDGETNFQFKRRKGKRPQFSREARAAGVSGSVMIWVNLNTEGRFENPMIVQPLGVGVETAILKAIKGWKYEVPEEYQNTDQIKVLLQFQYR